MSFQVRAGNSPHQHPAGGGGSGSGGGGGTYVSPNLSYRGGGGGGGGHHSNPPPFTLGDASGDGSGMPLPASKRLGTDPTKYKTTICRNWEQTGSCSFRGCTFAHGVDELRAPMRATGTSPPLGPQQQTSPSPTPPLYPQGVSAAVHNGSMSAVLQTSAGGVGSGVGVSKAEQLLEMLGVEMQRERDLVAVHVEANKALESMLRREQAQNVELTAKVEALQHQASELARQVKDRNTEILALVELASGVLTPEQRQRAESFASWNFASHNDLHHLSSGKSGGRLASGDHHHHHHHGESAPSITTGSGGASTQSSSSSSKGNNPSAPSWNPPNHDRKADAPPPPPPPPPQQQQSSSVSDATSVETTKIRDLLEALRQQS